MSRHKSPDGRSDPAVIRSRLKKIVRRATAYYIESRELFEQYWAICGAIGEHQFIKVLRILIDSTYNDLCERGEIHEGGE